MKLFLEFIVLCYATGLSGANQSFQYEKMHNYGIGRRVIQNYRRNRNAYDYPVVPISSTTLPTISRVFRRNFDGGNDHPTPLPATSLPPIALVRDPFPNLYQGTRRKSMDQRVFQKEFDYPPADVGHRISCESLVDCTISHLAIETEEGIPIILRGGVGYHHFTIIVRAKPGDPLKGTIKVYCFKPPLEP